MAVDDPRGVADVATLREVSHAIDLRVEFTAELLDESQELVLTDVSNDLELRGSSIEHDVCRIVPTTARFNLGHLLDWTHVRLRVGMRLTDQETGDSAAHFIGVFVLATPAEEADVFPHIWQVDAYDSLMLLDTAIPQTWQVAAGTSIGSAIAALLHAAEARLPVTAPPVDATTATDLTWPLGDGHTWLSVLNELVTSSGWRPVWVDRTGHLTTEQWIDPATLPTVHAFNTEHPQSAVADGATLVVDTWGIPNQWVAINDNATADAPTPGAGIVTVRNEGAGVSSILESGRVVNRVERVTAADQTALAAIADRMATDDRLPAEVVKLKVAPSPLLWHRDVVDINLPEIAVVHRKAVITKWSLPMDGSDMSVEAQLL